MTHTRQQQLAAARPSYWQDLLAGHAQQAAPTAVLSQTPHDDDHTPEAARRRVAAYRLAQQQAQLAADHPLEASIGAGVVIGGTVAASAQLG